MGTDRRMAISRHPLTIPLGLVVLTLLAYASSFPGAFILDDLVVINQNPLVQNPDLVTIFRSDYWHGIENSGLYRPLTILSLALNRLLLGDGAFGFHLVNVLLHAGVAVLLWRVLLAWELPGLAALGAALCFAVHPMHAEVVNEVVGRSELQVAFFLLLGFLFARLRGGLAESLVCLCFLLALLSKEHAITFLGLLPLWEAFHAGTPRIWRQRRRLYAGLITVAAAWLWWRKFGIINPLPPFVVTEAAAPLAYVDGVTRVLTALHHQGLYLAKLLLPHGLQAVYSVADLPPFIRSPLTVPGLLVVTGSLTTLGLLGWGWRHRQSVALFGVLYLTAFLPTSNLLFPIGVTMAERLAYFPSVWFCAGVGVLLGKLVEGGRWQRLGMVAMLGYLLLLGGMTLWRNLHFSDAVRLWTAEVTENPRDFLGWEGLAVSSYAVGRIEEADRAYARMLEINPDYPGGLRLRTGFFLSEKRFDLALSTAERVFSLSRSNGDKIDMAFDGLDLAEAHLGLGQCGLAGDYLDGPSQPLHNLRATLLRGAVLTCLGRDADAVAVYVGIDDQLMHPAARQQLGLSLMRLGRLDEARWQLGEAVKGVASADGWNLLGVVCAQQRDWPAAMEAFREAASLSPADSQYRQNLLQAQREASAKP